MNNQPNQLGFDALLRDADEDNIAHVFDRETAHLPCEWVEALAYHSEQIKQHHAAMLANDFEAAIAIRNDAHLLAKKLNGGNTGILAGQAAPGCRLDVQARAQDGEFPLWGQSGAFEVRATSVIAHVDMGGMFSIGATSMTYLGFSVRAIENDSPFLSNTGYRSFLGASVPPETGMTPIDFVRHVIEAHVEQVLHGKLVRIDPEYFKR